MTTYFKHTFCIFSTLFSFSLFSQNEFITHWSTPVDSIITIPTSLSSGPYNYTVSWQSLTNPGFNGSVSGQTGNYVISNVLANDTIEVKISGVFPHFYMRYGAERNFLTKVTQWGDNQWQNMSWAFEGCEKLILAASDTPDLTTVTSMEGMFSGCKMFNQPINNWDVSNITNMNDLFSSDSLFNQPLDTWNISNVTQINDMFSGALSFNQSLNSWDVSNVTTMKMVFAGAISFNQPLSNWNVSQVTDMYGMFNEAISFNQPIDSWNVSNVINMERMFLNASLFDQPVGSWIVSNVLRTNEMFRNAIVFNQPIDTWDVSSVEYMYEMFRGATAFNQPLNSWNVSNVTRMNMMFFGASSFNQAINNWDISNVNDMTDMLSGAIALSYCHYDDALNAWKSLPNVPTNISLGAAGVKYSVKGQYNRNLLNTYHNWTVIDGGITDGVVVTVTASNNGFCIGNTSMLEATSTMLGTSYIWNEGLPALNGHTVTPLITTDYVVIGTDGLGCKDSDTITVVVNQLPNILLQANQTTICERDTVSLTVTGGNDYFWNENLNPVASNLATPSISTEYIVIGIDIHGCESSDTLTINVNPAPNVVLQSNNSAICIGETTSLNASGADSYAWNQGLNNDATQNVNPILTTSYIVIGTDLQGCKNSDTLKMVVNALPIVTLQANKLVVCEGQSVNLLASGASTYTWNNGLSTGASKTVSPTTSLEYIVVGKDINGCENSDSLFITVENCLGISETKTDNIMVYPNPATDFIMLKGAELSSTFHTVQIINVAGKILYSAQVMYAEESIDVSNLIDGIYFVHLIGSQNKTFKIEVKK